jgi:branched-chain amino acid transport system substrate-binding protein
MRLSFIFLIFLLSASILTGCATQTTGLATHEPDTIKIGAALCLTGPCATTGDMNVKGIEMALADINAQELLDQDIEVVYEDITNGDAKNGVTAIKTLLQQDVNVIVGTTWTPPGLAAAPVACEAEAFMISPSLGAAEFAQECDTIFNFWTPDEALSTALGRQMFEDGHRNIAVLGSLHNWEYIQAKAIETSFEAMGGNVVAIELPPGDQKDFKTELTKIKATNPDAIYIQYTYEDVIAKQISELAMDIPIYVPLFDDIRIKNSDGTLEGATGVNQFNPTLEFQERFVEMYGVMPDFGSDTAYDATMLIAKAIAATGSTEPTVIAEYVRTIDVYDGYAGKLMFQEDGNVLKDFGFLTLKNGTLVSKS